MAGLAAARRALVRPVFPYTGTINWYPGHMTRATRKMALKAPEVDAVVQVCDARVPFSSYSTTLLEQAGLADKPRVIVLNKRDLANPALSQLVEQEFLRRVGVGRVIWTDAAAGRGIAQLAPALTQAVDAYRAAGGVTSVPRTQRPQMKARARRGGWRPRARLPPRPEGLLALVVGIPNVGKSTVLNALRARGVPGQPRKVAREGRLPGVTRHVEPIGIRVSHEPPIFLMDTPGVMLPRIDSAEQGLRLAVSGAIRDAVVGAELLADYLLYRLNAADLHSYVDMFALPGPSDSIDDVLTAVARRRGHLRRGGVPDTALAADSFLRQFRAGALGQLTLDDDALPELLADAPSLQHNM